MLSRGPGLPSYTDDKGNWTEAIGVLSLVVEGVLLMLVLAMLRAERRTAVAEPANGGPRREGSTLQRATRPGERASRVR